jgi:gliding motility-associated-like protein
MIFLSKRICPALFILFLLHDCVLAQGPVPSNRRYREIDSLSRMRIFHHQYTGNHAPIFPQQAVKTGIAGRSRLMATSRNLSQPAFRSAAHPVGITVCYDTSGRYFLQEDTMIYFVDASIRTADGNVLISGEWESTKNPNLTSGFLMKCSDSGTVQWARLYDSLNHKEFSFYSFYNLLELKDGSIMMAGITNDNVTGNNDQLLTHTDNTGNIIWSKAYKSRLWGQGSGSADYFDVRQLAQDPSSGDIFFTSPHWGQGKNITRVHITDGTLAWSRYYQMYGSWSFDNPFGLIVEPDELLCFGTADGYYGGTFTSLYRVNKNTGDTMSTRFYTTLDPSGFNLGVLQTEPVTKLNNGHYVIPGKLFKYYHWAGDTTQYLYHAGVEEFDANGNFVKAYCFRNNIESNLYNTRLQVNGDGTGVFSMMSYISGYSGDVYYVQFADGQILHQRKRHYPYGMPNDNRALRLPDGSDLIVKLLGDSITNINKIEFLDLHLSDTSSACLGVTDSSTSIQPYFMAPMRWGLDSIGSNDLYETRNRTISIRNDAPYFVHACQQVSHCDTLTLVPSSSTICIASPLLLTARKTPGCGAGMFLDYDTTIVQSYKQLNDFIYAFNFKSTGKATLRGSIRGCNLLTDSVKIQVLASKGQVDLGRDSVICPGNSILLHADSGYASYQWQDGSTDSVFTVLRPGSYNVTVTDGCGNRFTDTVLVSPHPPIPLDIGPDRSKCNNDTLQINAPPGFLSYNWGPLYNINTSSGPSVIINPLTDTVYYVKAEKSPGCFALDTIRVKVYHSPAIRMGNDTSICYGDSISLDAGAGFNSYLWSNGNTARRLIVYKAGTWWVKGTAANGCVSHDTSRLLNVWPLPVSNMDHDSLLCNGSRRVLQPGNFATYSWQDGSVGSSFTALDTGKYWVIVTDYHQCKMSDTVVISRILPSPAGFLPPDTAVCLYGNLKLEPLKYFESYLWSTGATSPSITVSKAGTFQLQVTDNYHCIGYDTIVVGTKDCLVGFYFPGAFTPNNDGHNDLFRPIFGGILSEYNITIFNRYGQIVFSSQDANQGWDGTFHGQLQGAGGYVWNCRYRFEGQPQQVEKGVVLLIR